MLSGLTFARGVVTYAQPSRVDATARARLVSEIAERFCELDEVEVCAASKLVRRLAAIAAVSHDGFHYCLCVLHGDTEAVRASFEERARAEGVTKQLIHHDWQVMIERVRAHWPAIADSLEEVWAAALNHEDPASQADVLRGSRLGPSCDEGGET